MGKYLYSQLEVLAAKKDSVKELKGKGLMLGLALDVPVADVVNKAIEKGLLVISAGGNVLRMLPPLIINKEDVDFAISVLEEIL